MGEGKSQMISCQNVPFRLRKFGKESLDGGQKSAWKDMLTYSQNSGWSLARKKNL